MCSENILTSNHADGCFFSEGGSTKV